MKNVFHNSLVSPMTICFASFSGGRKMGYIVGSYENQVMLAAAMFDPHASMFEKLEDTVFLQEQLHCSDVATECQDALISNEGGQIYLVWDVGRSGVE